MFIIYIIILQTWTSAQTHPVATMALAWTVLQTSPAFVEVAGKAKPAPFVPATVNQVPAAMVELVKTAAMGSLAIVPQDGKVLPVT